MSVAARADLTILLVTNTYRSLFFTPKVRVQLVGTRENTMILLTVIITLILGQAENNCPERLKMSS
jgi:hypothetical protein